MLPGHLSSALSDANLPINRALRAFYYPIYATLKLGVQGQRAQHATSVSIRQQFLAVIIRYCAYST